MKGSQQLREEDEAQSHPLRSAQVQGSETEQGDDEKADVNEDGRGGDEDVDRRRLARALEVGGPGASANGDDSEESHACGHDHRTSDHPQRGSHPGQGEWIEEAEEGEREGQLR